MVKYLLVLLLAGCGGGGDAPDLPLHGDCVQIPVVPQYDANGQCLEEHLRNKAPGLECRFWVGVNWACGTDPVPLLSGDVAPEDEYIPPEEGDDD